MNTLQQISQQHGGKVCDKWSLYLAEYDRIFGEFSERPVRLLEFGVQNGGSLEIWCKFFPNAERVIGCDIDPNCARLLYDDPRIRLVVADANTDPAEQQISAYSSSLDIIIDDGSHRSEEIIATFSRYFKHLDYNGLYIVEDLHCSYWREFSGGTIHAGGLFHPGSAIAFFKMLIDIVNHEHWGIDKARSELLLSFEQRYGVHFKEDSLRAIHSIEFVNSLCIIRKREADENTLGARIVSGTTEIVAPGIRALNGHPSVPLDQRRNEWSTREESKSEESLRSEVAELSRVLRHRDQQIADLQTRAARLETIEGELRAFREEMKAAKLQLIETEVALEAAQLAASTAQRQLSNIEEARREERAQWEAQIDEAVQAKEDAEAARAGFEQELAINRDALAALLGSTAWQMTYPIRRAAVYLPRPLRRMIRAGTKIVRPIVAVQTAHRVDGDPPSGVNRNLFSRVRSHARLYGWPATLKRGWRMRPRYVPQVARPRLAPAPVPTNPATPLARAFPELVPLITYSLPRDEQRRITLVTDSVNSGSLFGGVGTAILLSATLARRFGAGLRIVTELEAASPSGVAALLRVHGVEWRGDIDFVFSDRRQSERQPIDLRHDELFLTTAWWSTWNALQAVAARQIMHIIQEDERVFYPNGDARLRANEIMAHPEIGFIVNSHLLWEHLRQEGFNNFLRNGVCFEPAFPKGIYHWPKEHTTHHDTLNFLFYARPNHPRNLYIRGLEAINAALEKDIFDPARWKFIFAGSNIDSPPFLARDVVPNVLQNLPWHEYAALVRQIDLGLCLMHTPLPSYPPLDIAASGGVVVTNRYGCKQSLSFYSENILCVEADIASLVDSLEAGALLAANTEMRRQNYDQAGLKRSWDDAFIPAIERVEGFFKAAELAAEEG
jgi:O-antigen biosynthesis protein